MTFRRILVSILALSVLGSTHWSATLANTPAPTYTPMFTDDFETYSSGAPYPANSYWPDRTLVDTSRSLSGSKSNKITFQQGNNFFGGKQDLPTTAGEGETVWFRAFFYFPETFSFSADNITGDYWGFGKFMVLSQVGGGGSRMYMQLPSPSMKNYGDDGFSPAGILVGADAPMSTCWNPGNGLSWTVPRNRWVALQMAWKLSTTNGWVRLWADDTFIGECSTIMPQGYRVGNWGIGNYWNGGPWIQNSSTADFWMDDVVVTKQTPNTVDSQGRPYIHPSHFAGEFVSTAISPPNPPAIDQ